MNAYNGKLKESPRRGNLKMGVSKGKGPPPQPHEPMEKEMIDFGKDLLEWEEDVNGDLRAKVPFFSEHIKVRLYDRERGTEEEEDWEYRIELGSRELEAGVPAEEIETGIPRKNAVMDKKRFVEGRVQKAVEALYRNVH